MSEEHIAPNKSANEKIYLGIIVVLVIALAYLYLNRSPANAKPPVPAPAPVKRTTATPPPESMPVIEGWSQFPLADVSKQWLSENNVKSIILLDDKLQARVADKDGNEVNVCARQVDGGTGVAGDCATIKAARVTRATSITVEIRESSPGWCSTVIFGYRYYYPC